MIIIHHSIHRADYVVKLRLIVPLLNILGLKFVQFVLNLREPVFVSTERRSHGLNMVEIVAHALE